jgi:curved DNA-binding protein CbpA
VSRVRVLELLGLHAGATRDEIRLRYRELARKFHPDVNAGDERAHARFRAIVAAYQELLAADADAPAPREAAAGTAPPRGAEILHVPPGNIASLERAAQRSSSDGFARQRAELRARLDQRKKTLHRAQADARDGDAKALAARERGDDQRARHFERRVEADRSRVYALLGEIAGLERELRGLEAAPGGSDGEVPATRGSPAAGLDAAERLNQEVQRVQEEELAALQKKYKTIHKRR